ncbi:MAG TPA: DUF3048 domain-containing protein [Epulopiscium sp.]|nr:DUF3048 domain-containing protein [Candidatus Epulonipiscium sp.]
MRKYQFLASIIGMLLILFLLVGCNQKTSLDTQDYQDSESMQNDNILEEEKISTEGKAINPLTGLWIDEEVAKRRPVAVMINNLKKAFPQSGISQADIIYETLVEGEITRLMAVFQDFDAKKIGPVRSARHYYLDFALDHDAIYVHYGRSPQAEKAFEEWNVSHLEGISYLDEVMFWRDPERYNKPGMKEHSAYTNAEKILKAWDMVGYDKEKRKDLEPVFHFLEEEITPSKGQVAEVVLLPFSSYQVSEFRFDKDTNLYKRYQFGEPHIDIENNEQLTVKNIIVQFAPIYPIPKDTAGRKEVELVGKGTGLYITNGKAVPLTWSKKSHQSPTSFLNENGTVLKMNKGKTWVCVFPMNKDVELLSAHEMEE